MTNVSVRSNANELQKVEGSMGAVHCFSDSEVRAFTEYINQHLSNDKDLKDKLPLQNLDLFKAVSDGLLLIKLVNFATPDTIDERVINKKPKNEWQMRENQDLALTSASSIGCVTVNLGAADMLAGTSHLVLGLVWQIIRIGLVCKINLNDNPLLRRRLAEVFGESLDVLMGLSPEELLLRWVNYHLKNAGVDKRIRNFSSDIKDSEAYAHLLLQIAPKESKPRMSHASAILATRDLEQRAEDVLVNADVLNCREFLTPQDIVEGNAKLNLAFVANLFNKYPALGEPEPDDDVIQETREEKTFRNWINSLGLRSADGQWTAPYLNEIYHGLSNGLFLLAIIDAVKPGEVNWKRILYPPFKESDAQIKCRQNCKYAIEHAGNLAGVKLVSIGGDDIYDQRQTLVLGLLWQLMRAYTRRLLLSLHADLPESQTQADMDNYIITWTNQTLQSKGKSSSIKDFKDKSIASSVVIIDLIDSIREGTVDYSIVLQNPRTPEELMSNARLAINWGRKMGAQIYALPEDVVEVKTKMVMTIFACLMARALQNR